MFRRGNRRELDISGNVYKVVPRLRECCRQVEEEAVSNSRNKIHQTWEQPYGDSLYSPLPQGVSQPEILSKLFLGQLFSGSCCVLNAACLHFLLSGAKLISKQA